MNEHPFLAVCKDNGVRVVFTGVLSILALFLLAETITTAANFGRPGSPATDTITVQGSGQATLAPDVARVSFAVQNTAATVAEAQALTTKQANAAIAFVEEQGIAKKDTKTLSYNISPQYSYSTTVCTATQCPPSTAPKIIGYQVSETVQVTIRDLASVGTFLSGLGKLSVQNVNGPDFALDDATAGYAAARADAIQKAKVQASLLGEQLGVHVGKVVNFSESSGGYPSAMYDLRMVSAKAEMSSGATPSVPVGENTYTASVSITYEIR